MFYFIYETTNLINGKKYRGFHQTENLDDGYLGSGIGIMRAVRKYGRSNFTREVLEFCNSFEDLLIREFFYVDAVWVSRDDTYNMRTGGLGGSKHSTESRALMCKVQQEFWAGRECPQYIKDKISKSKLGQKIKNTNHWSKTDKRDVVVASIKLKNSGNIVSEETKNKLRLANFGKIQTVEHVEKRIKHLCKGVQQFTMDGILIAEFVSMTKATLETKTNKANIMSVCQGKRRQAGGFIWKYINN